MATTDGRSATEHGDVRRSVSRLEDAVNDLVAAAGESAAEHIENAAERVRRQVGSRSSYRERPRREPVWLWSEEPRSARLYRDKQRGKLMGVCAGIGRYFGIEVWIVRCIAITAVIFLNWVAVVAYFVAGFILDADPPASSARSESRRSRRRDRKRDRRAERRERTARYAPPSPKQQLRTVDADFDEIELRLRRMETYVTSGRYELHREFSRIGDGT